MWLCDYALVCIHVYGQLRRGGELGHPRGEVGAAPAVDVREGVEDLGRGASAPA